MLMFPFVPQANMKNFARQVILAILGQDANLKI